MHPERSSGAEMPAAAAGFTEDLNHTEVRTMQAITLPREEGGSDAYTKFTDERGGVECEVGSAPGNFRNFRLRQQDGTWTDVIPTVDKLPLIYREYLFHVSVSLTMLELPS